jgi:hypothetical protein
LPSRYATSSRSHGPPDRYAATDAATPSGVGPATSNPGRARQHAASVWLVVTTCAHFNPGMFQAFDAEVTVTECSAAAGETVA